MAFGTGTPNSRATVWASAGVVCVVTISLTILAETGKDATSLVKVLLALLPVTGFSALSYIRGAANGRDIAEVKDIAVQNHAATAQLNATLPNTVNKVDALRKSIDGTLGK